MTLLNVNISRNTAREDLSLLIHEQKISTVNVENRQLEMDALIENVQRLEIQLKESKDQQKEIKVQLNKTYQEEKEVYTLKNVNLTKHLDIERKAITALEKNAMESNARIMELETRVVQAEKLQAKAENKRLSEGQTLTIETNKSREQLLLVSNENRKLKSKMVRETKSGSRISSILKKNTQTSFFNVINIFGYLFTTLFIYY